MKSNFTINSMISRSSFATKLGSRKKIIKPKEELVVEKEERAPGEIVRQMSDSSSASQKKTGLLSRKPSNFIR